MKIRSAKYFLLSMLSVLFSLPIAAQDLKDVEKGDAKKGSELLEKMSFALIESGADLGEVVTVGSNTIYNPNAPGGKMSMDSESTINFAEMNLTTKMNTPQGTLTTELKDGKGKQKMFGQERPMPDAQVKQVEASIRRHYLNVALNEDSYEAEYMGTEEYDGKVYDKLKVNIEKPVTFLLDQESHFPHVMRYKQFSQQEGKQITVEERYSNWEINDGIAFAHETKTLEGAKVSQEATYKSVNFSKDGNYVPSRSLGNTLKQEMISPKTIITKEVQKRIQSWQQKGKYETTRAYRERVTEQKRAELIQQYTTNLVDSLGRARFDTHITKTDYDADNQVFEVTFADKSSIYVNVPVNEAQRFDQNLYRLRFSNMDFTLTSGGELMLRKAQIHNPANDQTYAYDSGREVAFNTAELAANFDPIEVEVQTEDVQTNVKKGTKKIEVGKADVDVNIPETAMYKPDGIAVVIGNRRYQGDTPDVDYAVNDAKVMREYLIKTLGFRPGNILYEENAGLSRMRVLFGDERNDGKLANYLKPGRSDVFVFYSGHGAPDPNTETGYLIPVDGDASALNITGYPLEVLYDNLAQLDAKSVSVVIDACFSGASGGGEMLLEEASPIGIEIQNPAAKLDDGIVVTASSGSQVSSWYPAKGHGLLTYFWLKALQGAADQNGDKAVTASEIRTYLNDNSDGLPYWARRLHNREQTPQVFSNDVDKVIVQHN